MPPGLHPRCRVRLPSSRATTIASFLVPFLQPSYQTARAASVLGALSDVPAAYHKKIRRGRGASSGKGKTSGRGHKGQKQHGKVPAGFEGGQTPLEVVHGKRGFNNVFSIDMTTVNLDKIQSWIAQGRLDARQPITVKELKSSGCLGSIKDGVKLLARSEEPLTYPIHITVSRASAAAIAAVEAAGGSVQTRYYTRDSIKRVVRGLTHPTLSLLSPPPSAPTPTPSATTTADSPADAPAPQPTSRLPPHLAPMAQYRYRLPDATSRKDMEYYRDPAHRGYLSHLVGEGQGPSLFFKTPRQIATGAPRRAKRAPRADAGEGDGAAGKGKSEVKLF